MEWGGGWWAEERGGSPRSTYVAGMMLLLSCSRHGETRDQERRRTQTGQEVGWDIEKVTVLRLYTQNSRKRLGHPE